MRKDFIFTSESIAEGHPDKVCDQISDAIVDRFLRQDPAAAIIAECGVATAIVFIAARFAAASVDIPDVARQVITQMGYEQPDFNGKTCSVVTSLKEMPRDDRGWLDENELPEEEMDRLTVKNQVTVFGFVCDQTPGLMPLPIWFGPQAGQETDISAAAKTLTLSHARRENAGRGRISRSPTRSHP